MKIGITLITSSFLWLGLDNYWGHFLQMIRILQMRRPVAKRAKRPILYDDVLEKYFLKFCIWTFIILSGSELTWDPNQGECVCATLDTAGSYPTLLTHHLHHTGKSIIRLWVRHDKGKMWAKISWVKFDSSHTNPITLENLSFDFENWDSE